MLKARVKYNGWSENGNYDRYAEIKTSVDNIDKVSNIISDIGYNYDIFEDYEEAVFMVYVDDMDDYKKFMNYWKEAKRTA